MALESTSSNDIYERFYSAYADLYRKLGLMKTVWMSDTAAEMLVGPPDEEGWVEWQLVKPAVSLSNGLEVLATKAGIRLPASFKSWFGRYYTLDMSCSMVRLPKCLPSKPFADLKDRWIPTHYYYEHIRDLKLLPFGHEAMMDAGPLCFDMRVDREDADWPIVYWDHEWDGRPQEIGPAIFSSFEKLIECVTFSLEHHGEKIAVINEAIFTIDPSGAGGPGREYWRSWAWEDDES